MIPALSPWQTFYSVLGEASATMIGLLFVAASIASGIFSRSRVGALRMFLSATVVHFGSVLAASLAAVAPIASSTVLGSLVLAFALVGLAYYAVTWLTAVRDGIHTRIDTEDRVWYGVLPVLGYGAEAGSGVALAANPDQGCPALALAMALLLLVAIHNAWDITVWSITAEKK